MGILILLFTVVPIIELFLLIEVGQVIGAWDTVLIVLVTGVIGAYLARSQGMAIWFESQRQMARGQLPADSLVHGFLVFLGGILLVTPGFLTDVFGLSLVIPFTRRIYISSVKSFFAKRMKSGNFHVYANVNGEWEEVRERDVSPQRSRMQEPAKVIDIKSFRRSSE